MAPTSTPTSVLWQLETFAGEDRLQTPLGKPKLISAICFVLKRTERKKMIERKMEILCLRRFSPSKPCEIHVLLSVQNKETSFRRNRWLKDDENHFEKPSYAFQTTENKLQTVPLRIELGSSRILQHARTEELWRKTQPHNAAHHCWLETALGRDRGGTRTKLAAASSTGTGTARPRRKRQLPKGLFFLFGAAGLFIQRENEGRGFSVPHAQEGDRGLRNALNLPRMG